MTRFARAKGSKSSNERVPENATSWAEMKEQLLNKDKEIAENQKRKEVLDQRNKNYSKFLEDKKLDESKKTSWSDFSNGSTPSQKVKRKVENFSGDLTKHETNDDSDAPPEEESAKKQITKPLTKIKKPKQKKTLLHLFERREGKSKQIGNNENTETEIKTQLKEDSPKKKLKKIKVNGGLEKKSIVKENLTEKDIKKIEKKKQKRIKQLLKKKAELKKKKEEKVVTQSNSNADTFNESHTDNNVDNGLEQGKSIIKENLTEKDLKKIEKKKQKRTKQLLKKAELKMEKREEVVNQSNPNAGALNERHTNNKIDNGLEQGKSIIKENLTEKDLKKIEKKKQKRIKQLLKKKAELKMEKGEEVVNQSNPNAGALKEGHTTKNTHLNSTKKKKAKKSEEQHHRKKDFLPTKMFINGKTIEVSYVDGFPVKKEDAERLKKLRKEMISKGLPRSEINITLKLERRKAEKSFAREKKKVCFNCRQSGHNLSECPDLDTNKLFQTAGSSICFKCGSTEHTHFECKTVRGQEYKFATCFICNEQGHISRQCPDNARGLYPKGGACNVCGDVTHLKKDCPKHHAQQQRQADDLTIETSGNRNPDEMEETHNKSGAILYNKQPNKIIKF